MTCKIWSSSSCRHACHLPPHHDGLIISGTVSLNNIKPSFINCLYPTVFYHNNGSNTAPLEHMSRDTPVAPRPLLPTSTKQILLSDMASSSATFQQLLSTVTSDLPITDDTRLRPLFQTTYLTPSPKLPKHSILIFKTNLAAVSPFPGSMKDNALPRNVNSKSQFVPSSSPPRT